MAKAHVDHELLVLKERYKRWNYSQEPKMDMSKLIIAGRNSLKYIASNDDTTVRYVIPVDDKYYLYLMFDSIDNSKHSAGWQELSEREQSNFLQSLELTGGDSTCN